MRNADAEHSIDGFKIETRNAQRPLLPRQVQPDAYLAALVESSEDAIISKDLGGIVTTWNRAAEEMFGYRAEEMIGKPVNVIIPPDRAEEEWQILQQVASGERLRHFETLRVKRDGTELDVSLAVSSFRHRSILFRFQCSRRS